MNEFSENNLVEQSAIKIFAELWGAKNFANAYSGEMDAEFGRENPGEVVLINYLKISLVKLNPDASTEALNLAIDEIIKDRSAMSMVNANHEVWQLLKDGVKVETENEEGGRQTETVKVIDFENPGNNHFMLVSQLWITGELHKRPSLFLTALKAKSARSPARMSILTNGRKSKGIQKTLGQLYFCYDHRSN